VKCSHGLRCFVKCSNELYVKVSSKSDYQSTQSYKKTTRPESHGYVHITSRGMFGRRGEHMTGAAREVSGGRPDLKQDIILT
jgi:hypothetical protein